MGLQRGQVLPEGRSQAGPHGRTYRARVHGQQDRHISGRKETQNSHLLHLRSLTFCDTRESSFCSLHQLEFGDPMSMAGWWAEIVPCDTKGPRELEERLRTCQLFRCSSCYSGFNPLAENSHALQQGLLFSRRRQREVPTLTHFHRVPRVPRGPSLSSPARHVCRRRSSTPGVRDAQAAGATEPRRGSRGSDAPVRRAPHPTELQVYVSFSTGSASLGCWETVTDCFPPCPASITYQI